MRRIATGLIVLGLAAAACGGGETLRDTSGQVAEAGTTSVFELRTGDCFDDPTTEGDVIFEIPVVPCNEPHDNEVYHEYSMSQAEFPGDDATFEAGAVRCRDRFQAYVGIDYQDSDLEIVPIVPTAESWDTGDRVVYCVLFAIDRSKLTGTMRNSGR